MSTSISKEVFLTEGKGSRDKDVSKEVDKFTDWKNEPTLAQLQADYENAIPYHDEYIDKLNAWSLTMDGGVLPPKSGGRSRYRSKTVRKQYEWTYPLVEEPLLNAPNIFSITGTTKESLPNEATNTELLNYQWNSSIDKLSLINDASRAFVNEGTAIVKLGWNFEYDEVTETIKEDRYADTNDEILKAVRSLIDKGYNISEEQMRAISNKEDLIKIGVKDVEVQRIKIHKNHPTYTVVDNDSLIVDPKCKGSVQDINFAIEEIEIGFSQLKDNEYREITFTPSNGKKTVTKVGHYYNLDKVEESIFNTIKKHKAELRENEADTTAFKYEDVARHKVIMYEYWGFYDIHGKGKLTPIVASWIDDVMVRLEVNPYAHGELPYSFGKFMPVKGSIHGEPNSELLKTDQDAISSIFRGMQDISARGAVGQTWINEDLFYNTVQKNNYKKGMPVYYRGNLNPKDAVYREVPQEIPQSMYKMTETHQREAEQLTGTIPYNHGNPNAKPSGIGSNKSEDDATTQRDMGILRRFTAMIQDLGRKTVKLNQEYITSDTVIRLTGKNNFKVIQESDLKGTFNTIVTISTPQKNDSTANKILAMMQTNAASMHPKLANLHYMRIAKLWNQEDMADEIQAIMEEPPNEMEQRMQQLEIEMRELEVRKAKMSLFIDASKIKESAMRFSETAVSALTDSNAANAEYRLAQAEKLKAQTELFNQELDYIASGLRMKEEVLHNEYQHAANMEREDVRTKRERDNIHIKENGGKGGNTKQINHAVGETKKVIDSTLNSEMADGSNPKFHGIRENNSEDLLQQVNGV